VYIANTIIPNFATMALERFSRWMKFIRFGIILQNCLAVVALQLYANDNLKAGA
jgi:hypothetical protein